MITLRITAVRYHAANARFAGCAGRVEVSPAQVRRAGEIFLKLHFEHAGT